MDSPERLSEHELERFVAEHGLALLAVARRYTRCGSDADDVYQQTLEAVFTSAPTTDPPKLAAWAKTVAKNKALDELRRETRHAETTDDIEHAVDEASVEPAVELVTDERNQQLGEAIRRLRPDHARCLLLRAEGLGYPAICDATGFSYAKVNRCLSEGRTSLLVGYSRIADGSECSRLSGLLSEYADGVASAEIAEDVRLHLKSCLACQVTLREFRAAPRRVASVFPVAAVGVGDPSIVDRLAMPFRRVGDWFQAAAGSAQEQFAARVASGQSAVELATAKNAMLALAAGATITAGAVGSAKLIESDDRQPSETPAGEVTGQTGPDQSIPGARPVEETTESAKPKAETSRDAEDTDAEDAESVSRDEQSRDAYEPPQQQSAPAAADEFSAPSGSPSGDGGGSNPADAGLAP